MSPVVPQTDGRPAVAGALCQRFRRRYCVLTNRGTTALAAAFHALDRPAGTRAVFPAVLCSIPVFAARFAGWEPDFADVNVNDANFDLADLERTLKEARGRVGAIVPVHMFGKVDDMDALTALAAAHGASVVEDLALSLGATRNGRAAGTFGRLACLSFVRKTLPLETGGAVLTDEPALARRAQAFVDALPALPPGVHEEVPAALRAFHALTGYVAAGNWRRREWLGGFGEEFRRLFLGRTAAEDWDAEAALAELDRLEEGIAARRARAEVYDTVLTHERVRPLDREGSALFAYPVRLQGWAVEEALAFAAEQGYTFKRIAYPDVHRVFSPGRSLPTAAVMEKEILGLPLDERRPVAEFWEYAQDLQRVLGNFEKERRPSLDLRGRLEMRMGSLP